MVPPSEEFAQDRRRRYRSAMRAGPGVLVCPRCGIPLLGSDHELGIAWRCKACGGQSLNFSQFRRMVPEHGANDIWLQAATRPNAPMQRTECPECQGGMDAVLIPFRGSQVELDICRACQRLWLDRQETAATASLAMVSGAGGKPGAPSRAKADSMLELLEFRDDRQAEETERKQRVSEAVFFLVAGLLTVLATSGMTEKTGRAWVAGVVVVICYGVRMLWRRHRDGPGDEK